MRSTRHSDPQNLPNTQVKRQGDNYIPKMVTSSEAKKPKGEDSCRVLPSFAKQRWAFKAPERTAMSLLGLLKRRARLADMGIGLCISGLVGHQLKAKTEVEAGIQGPECSRRGGHGREHFGVKRLTRWCSRFYEVVQCALQESESSLPTAPRIRRLSLALVGPGKAFSTTDLQKFLSSGTGRA